MDVRITLLQVFFFILTLHSHQTNITTTMQSENPFNSDFKNLECYLSIRCQRQKRAVAIHPPNQNIYKNHLYNLLKNGVNIKILHHLLGNFISFLNI